MENLCKSRPYPRNQSDSGWKFRLIHVGLDVHKQTTAVAVSQGPSRACFVGTVDSDPDVLLKVLGKLGAARDLSVVLSLPRMRRGTVLHPPRPLDSIELPQLAGIAGLV